MKSDMGKCHTTGTVFSHPCRLSLVWLRATPESVGSTEANKNWRRSLLYMPLPLGRARYTQLHLELILV